ncbi:MAG: hypothetical protein GY810_19555 [Aureispira sp.]|nr:hypothetical protein [Aureispira sp.]
MNAYQIKELKDKIERLRSLDQHCLIFGAANHTYDLQECLREEDIKTFENTHKVQLPIDYRNFVRYVGNGGVGPYQGMFGLVHSSHIQQPFKGEWTLIQQKYTQDLAIDRTQLLQFHMESLLQHLNAEEIADMHTLALFRKCMKLDIALGKEEGEYYNFYPDYCEEHELEDYFKELELDNESITGYIPLFNYGNGHLLALVVNGQDYGQVIFKGKQGEFRNHRVTFYEFYKNWLDTHLANFEHLDLLLKTSLPLSSIVQAQLYQRQLNYSPQDIIESILDINDLEEATVQPKRELLKQGLSTKTKAEPGPQDEEPKDHLPTDDNDPPKQGFWGQVKNWLD